MYKLDVLWKNGLVNEWVGCGKVKMEVITYAH